MEIGHDGKATNFINIKGLKVKQVLLNELKIINPIQKALTAQGYSEATPIQAEAIPPLLAGRDLLGCAQTGTGKTATLAIPILQSLAMGQGLLKGKKQIRALVLAPTRELATQIAESFTAYGVNLPLRTLVIFGGVGQVPQTRKLEKGIDILVATPGRLLDLINQGFIDLSHVEHFVLDETDQMLDMGMLHDVKRIITYLPRERQNMLFSATMPVEIEKLADTILKEPVKIAITPERSPLDIIEQEVYFVDKANKTALLTYLLKNSEYDSVLVFSRTKHGADKIVKELNKKGFAAVAIHGNKSQANREQALNAFKKRKTRILVATDIAARGLDIQELSHVINYNLPEVPETYIHRIGRTGRAGLGGKAITFCDFEEKPLLRDIQKRIGKTLPEVKEHPYPLVNIVIEPKTKTSQRAASSRPQKPATARTAAYSKQGAYKSKPTT
ncbi:DNA/RNA helicase, superfamily II [Desulfitobacterium dehalogenans ATCC 51507]|uniref:DNA/RNA helicase, superfamily II n=1 Tax=Desulfitobacterium dehalogenans (strain ATCC 51507 / DSM 9161 / JW/IU-DC1) TaxID=756499 RepID=I4A807_DESDJ|nr:DNA/RNA helicase, superfamily II [Desulfitobacterium dehalogenans ATCC 51507]